MSLYTLQDDFMKLQFMLEDETFDEEAISEALESVDGQLEEKFENYVKVAKNIEAKELALKAEMARMKDRKTVLENRRNRLLQSLQTAMELTKKTKVDGVLFNMSLRARPKSVSVIDESLIPAIYMNTKTETKLDKKAIADAIKSGTSVDGVKYESLGNTLKIS